MHRNKRWGCRQNWGENIGTRTLVGRLEEAGRGVERKTENWDEGKLELSGQGHWDWSWGKLGWICLMKLQCRDSLLLNPGKYLRNSCRVCNWNSSQLNLNREEGYRGQGCYVLCKEYNEQISGRLLKIYKQSGKETDWGEFIQISRRKLKG